MPSSHTSSVAGLATALAIRTGLQSPEFAICAVFLLVVAYDASGVRHEAGKHAAVLNAMLSQLHPDHPADDVLRPGETLKTPLGHKPVEVVVGGLVGLIVGFIVETAT
jgi:uncharacterized protein